MTVALSRGAEWAWLLLGLSLLLRILTGFIFGKVVLQGKNVIRSLWLIPIRDLLGVVIWIGGWVGNRIVWRGENFRLRKGKLEPMA
jgi:ceramide glucosyltransferase